MMPRPTLNMLASVVAFAAIVAAAPLSPRAASLECCQTTIDVRKPFYSSLPFLLGLTKISAAITFGHINSARLTGSTWSDGTGLSRSHWGRLCGAQPRNGAQWKVHVNGCAILSSH